MCMCARSMDKKMKTGERGRDGAKVYVVATKGKPNAQGEMVNRTSLSEPERPETWVYGRCARIY